MKTTSKLLLLAIILLLVGLGTISATDNIQNTTQSTDTVSKEITSNKVISEVSTEKNADTINQIKTIEKNNNKQNNSQKIKEAGRIKTVIQDTYDQYFTDKTTYYDPDGNEITNIVGLVEGRDYTTKITKVTTENVEEGDTLNLKGEFNGLEFKVDKKITLTSLNKNAMLTNCKVYITPSGNGSTIANLTIKNYESHTSGIMIDCSSNLLIENNNVSVNSSEAHAFDAVVNNSVIRSNYFETTRTTTSSDARTHTAMVFCSSWYNTIENNTVYSDGANVIYFSTYPGQSGLLHGGSSHYNNVTGNIVSGANSGWSYSIQVMGTNNIIAYNNVSKGYRGISTANDYNIIHDNDVDAVSVGIYASDNTAVYNNYIHMNTSGSALQAAGARIDIHNNTIVSHGISIEIQSSDINVTNNIITSDSNGIYGKGGYSNIRIENNKITTKADSILFGNTGIYQKINHVYINNNTIVSESDYALNLKDAGALRAADVNITVTQSNILSSAKGTGDVAYLPPSNANGTISLDTNQLVTIDSANYTQWFENGVAKDSIKQNATVYLIGTFNNINFEFIKKVHVIGQNAQINNGTITLSQDAHASTITNVTIKNTANKYTVHAIELIEVNNCNITSATIENYAQYESIGIFLYSSSATTVSKNNITTSGDYVNNAIMVYGSISNTIENNTININQSNVTQGYASSIMFNDRIGTIQEVLHTHGIMLVYSSNNIINNNNIKGNSQFTSYAQPSRDCQNSIVGIDIYFESDNNIVTNNKINIESYGPFTYGMGVLGGQWGTSPSSKNSTNNAYQNNNVTLKGGYFTTGFIAGRNSINTIIKNNTFSIESRRNNFTKGDYAFGITLENSTNSNITGNTLTTTAKSVYGMELFESGYNTITHNTLTATATYPYAIAGYAASYNNIKNNTFTLNKADYGEVSSAEHADAIPYGDDGIMLMSSSSNNNITYNSIHTQANYTIKLTNETSNNIIQENSLLSANECGDNSVFAQGISNIVSNNFLHFVNVTADSINAKRGDQVTLTAHITSTTTDLSNLTAEFRLGTNIVGTSNVENNQATLNYMTFSLNPTVYQLTVTVKGNNFQNATGISQLSLDPVKEQTFITVDKVTQIKNKTVTLTAKVTKNEGIVGTGQVEFYIDDEKIGVVNISVGGIASINYTIDPEALSTVHIIKATYLGTSDLANSTNTSILGIQSSSIITVNDISAKLDENANIQANIKSDGINVQTGTVKLLIDNKELATVQINNGNIVYSGIISAKTFNSGVYELKIVYEGNDTIAPTNATSTITISPVNPVFHYNTTSVGIGDVVVLNLVIDNGKNNSARVVADNGNVSVLLNNEILTNSNGNPIIAKINNGIVTFTFTAPAALYGSQDIGFIFSGNSKFNQSTVNYKNGLIIGKKSVLTLYTIENNTNPTKITGKLLDDEGNGINGAQLSLTVNDEIFNITTGSSGYFSFNYVPSTSGNFDVSITFKGNTSYGPSSDNSSFSITKKKTTLYLYNIDNSTSSVKITGKLLSENKAINGAKLSLKVNNNLYTITPGSSGYFSYTIEAENGINNVIVTYEGNNNYENATATTSFTSYAKKKATLYLYSIDNSTSTVKISGKLLGDGKAISGAKLTLTVNGKEYTVTPGSSGYFSYTINADNGVNTVLVTFDGNDVYAQTTVDTTFTSYAKKKATLYLYSIDNSTSSVKITGKLLGDGKAISGAKLTLTVNGKEYTVTPGSSGYFSYKINAEAGVNNVVVNYAGNDVYAQESVSTSFTSNAKKQVVFYGYALSETKVGQTSTISGKLLTTDKKAIAGKTITINIGSQQYSTTTNKDGYFAYKYTTNVKGTHNITVSFDGDEEYASSQYNTTLTVN